MKRKIKKSIALVLLGITLCGGALTAQAATTGNCYTHQGVRINTGTHPNTYQHVHGAKTCTVTQKYQDYKIVCTKCGVVLSTGSELITETHTIQ